MQQAARSLHEAGWLQKFHTTFRDDPTSLWQRAACTAARLTGRDLRAQFRRRAVTEIPLDHVATHPLGELLRLASGTFDRTGRLTDFVWERAENAFARKVGRHLPRDLSALYGFEYSSRAAFEIARARGLKIFYDVPAPEPRFVQQLIDRETGKFPELVTAYHRHTAAREERRIAHRRREWELADLVIAASAFTRRTYAAAGLDVSKVRIVPYGAPPPAPRAAALARSSDHSATPTFVWAGTFSIRKGAHYLLEAWRAGHLGRHARLEVYGTVALPPRLLSPSLDGVTFHGPVSRPDLLTAFQRADALVFPTLCDGFGLVVNEAWSQGLPVLTTDRAGAADLLRPGENGLLVPAADAAALQHQLAEIAAAPAAIRALRETALASAARWQWSDYRSALTRHLAPLLPSVR